jgi:hypothetical protein
MSPKISTDAERKIIEEFAKEIKAKRQKGSKPEKAVIAFRNDELHGIERQIWSVPTNILRFRKDNGRIASDITSYERLNGLLDERKQETQNIIRGFLEKNDEVANVKLSNLIEHSGQKIPAIITCDGFLINGNRRKMTIESLFEKTKDKKFETMKVVILPGNGNEEEDEGGPPTLKEIEQIENSYQLQSDGKSEYTHFDRAISIRRKIRAGMTLEEQLKADPTLITLTDKEFKKEMQRVQDELLGPLECIDRYLDQNQRSGLYATISDGRTDRDGRWYSFIPYYQLYRQLQDDKRRTDLGIEEDEVGDIEDVAFKIIRKKDFPESVKLMQVVRTIPKILKNKDAKKELMKIQTNTVELSKSEVNDDDDLKAIDKKWGHKNGTLIIGRVKEAIRRLDHERDTETPVTLLEDSLKKLNHENMIPEVTAATKLKEAFEKTKEIQERAHELEKIFWKLYQNYKGLGGKK